MNELLLLSLNSKPDDDETDDGGDKMSLNWHIVIKLPFIAPKYGL